MSDRNSWLRCCRLSTTESTASKVRWLILFNSCLIQILNQMNYLSYSPIANIVDSLYGKLTVNTLAIVYMVTAFLACCFSMWCGSRFKLHWLMLAPACSNALGAVLRVLTTPKLDEPDWLQLKLLQLGYVFMGVSFSFGFFLPVKVSAIWFPARERPLATSINAAAGPIGILLIGSIAPSVVQDKSDVFVLNCLVGGLALFTAGFTLAVTRFHEPVIQDQPLVQPYSGYLDFKDGLVAAVKNKTLMLLVFSLGGGVGVFFCFFSIIEQLLCPSGYSNRFVGVCLILFIISGLIFAGIAGFLAGKYGGYELILKVCSCTVTLFSIGFAISSRYPNLQGVVGVLIAGMGGFGLIMNGMGLEAAAETAFPVPETTAAGLIGMSAMLQGGLYLLVLEKLFMSPSSRDIKYGTCEISTGKQLVTHDVTYSLVAFLAILAFHTIILTLFVKPKYHRWNYEGAEATENDVVDPIERY